MTELIQTSPVQEHGATRIPDDDDPVLACTFGIQVSAVDDMASDLYFQRKEGTDSMWMEAEPRYRSESITAPTHGSAKSACKRLFKAHIRKSQRYESITRLISPGLLSASGYRSALHEVFPDAAHEEAFMEGYRSVLNEVFPDAEHEEAFMEGDPVIACEFWLSIIVDNIDAVLYFQRNEGTDSVWVKTEFDYGADPITAPTRGSAKRACKRLFKEHIRQHGGYQFPAELIAPGLLSACSYRSALKEVVHEIDENKRQADRHSHAEIIETARALRLRPEPSGDSPNNWIANCPGGQHSIMVAPTSNEFGCGYCRIKGGPDVLREFANR
jgi:hypothetical protein